MKSTIYTSAADFNKDVLETSEMGMVLFSLPGDSE